MGNKIKADLFLSMGDGCRAAKQLNANGLRLFSTPLDWMLDYTLDHAFELYKSAFVSFFKDHYEEHSDSSSFQRVVIDKQNGMRSIHHFSKEIDLKDSFDSFHITNKKRCERIIGYAKKSKHIVLICNRNETIEKLTEFLKNISEVFPCKLTLVNIVSVEGETLFTQKTHAINDKFKIIEFFFNDNPDNPNPRNAWKGNSRNWRKCLKLFAFSNKSKILFSIFSIGFFLKKKKKKIKRSIRKNRKQIR